MAFLYLLGVVFHGCNATANLLHNLILHLKYQINVYSANYNVWIDYNVQYMHSAMAYHVEYIQYE